MEDDPGSVRCDCPEEGSALGLIALMTGISEECWCASWMSGLEFDCWAAIEAGTPYRYGQGEISERQVSLLRLLSEESGGWWRYHGFDKPRFVSLDDWRAHLATVAKAEAAE